MEKSFNPKAEILSAQIVDAQLSLSVKITCEYNPLVHSPKVVSVFLSGNVSRYIPLLVQAYYQNVSLDTCTIIAEYKYDLTSIFLKNVWDRPVKLNFALHYGENYCEDVPQSISEDIKSSNDYKLEFDDTVAISKLIKDEERSFLLKTVRWIIGGLYYFIVRLIGIVFIPWLLIDSLMAYFDFKTGYVTKNDRSFPRFVIDYLRVGFKYITHEDIGRGNFKKNLAIFASFLYRNSKIVPNQITFLSNRRDDLSGNFEDIYGVLKDNKDIVIKFHLDPQPMHRMTVANIIKFAKLYATSAVVIVDDFYELTSSVKKRDEVKLVQVWHACGAFKTFGFTRLGKPGGPRQTNVNHRMYDKAIVSSEEIRKFYAEGFGIPLQNVVATGIPRTDMFFSEEIKHKKQAEFYERYPKLRDKKIMLFAPTFRGNGRLTGNYPVDKFNLKKVYEETNGEYAILVKMHPFVNNTFKIPEKYKDFIIDFSTDSELNDLLFVTDLLITDYSSAIFEASLLNIPMLFYAYDLSEYIATRDFYYEYELFLPGRIAGTLSDLIKDINEGDFETEKIPAFKERFFDNLDGKSSERVASMILGLLK